MGGKTREWAARPPCPFNPGQNPPFQKPWVLFLATEGIQGDSLVGRPGIGSWGLPEWKVWLFLFQVCCSSSPQLCHTKVQGWQDCRPTGRDCQLQAPCTCSGYRRVGAEAAQSLVPRPATVILLILRSAISGPGIYCVLPDRLLKASVSLVSIAFQHSVTISQLTEGFFFSWFGTPI